MSRELIIYCDESIERGPRFSNFYGGALVSGRDIPEVSSRIADAKTRLNLFQEVKWTKITGNYCGKYIELMDEFFALIEEGKVKVRIMFTNNRIEPIGISRQQRENEYFLLYYQFIKHAFGLAYSNTENLDTKVRIYLDRMPDTKEKVERFKSYLAALSKNPQFRAAKTRIDKDEVTEIDSHKHTILQCLDIVLGAIQFKLNGHNLRKPVGQTSRGKRTVAKEKVYKHINGRIRQIQPGFNVGISTGIRGDPSNRWLHPYRHWLFLPGNHAPRQP